ncbi:MAG: hypothetical protein IT280_02860 [Ignavibacteria bacterium]|nr:hypothetical protein [Ignavibacteria bacterium]
MRKNKIKLAFLTLLFLLLIFNACNSNRSKQNNTQNQKNSQDTVKINKDQYRVAEMFTGNKNQIIDLIQGPATFDLIHQGSGSFKCTLMYADGQVVDVLADVTGDYKGKKKVNVPETRAYVLDVKTEGTWSVYRE